MGIILRQSIKSSIYSYIGAFVGFLSVGILMPAFLTQSEIGLRMQIQSYAFLFSSIIAFGLPQTIVRMFPHLEDSSNKNNGVLSLLGIIMFASSLLFIAAFSYFGDIFFKSDIENSPLFAQHYALIIPFTIATLIFITLDGYATARRESTIGTFLKDIVLRLGMITALVGYMLFDSIDYTALIQSITVIQYIPIFLLIFFLHRKGLFPFTTQISFPSPELKKEFISVSGYNWINIISGVAVVTIDSVMLSKLGGSADVGIYTTVTFFASIMMIPMKGISKIANTVIATHFKNGDLQLIQDTYEKITLNLLIIGLFLFGNLMLIIPFIFNILLKGYEAGIGVLIFIGLANLIKMATGVKFILIGNSSFYRWSSLFLIIFIASLIITNLIFIPIYGIVGAAMASLISSLIYQTLGILFVKRKFSIWPFHKTYLKTSILFVVLGGLVYFIPMSIPAEYSGIIKSALFSITSLFFIWKLQISPDLNDKINDLLLKFKS